VGELSGSGIAELVEEPVEGGVVLACRCPDQTAGVVIDHDGQVAMTALVGDLIDPDTDQPVETVRRSVGIGADALDDRPDGAPRDP